ncbi:MAG: hypothetical protein HPY67_00160 [Syntrophaceae bacterium]|nr:hypothetical protein [Syntrophaceae bacterium]
MERIGKQENILFDRLLAVRGKYRYDCVVGLSGGKDSSYIIHRLKNHYGANVLAYTCDNGFLNDYALQNIRTVVNDLGVDHLWVKLPDDFLRRLYRGSMLAEGWPCTACFYLLEASGWQLAYEHKIPFIVNGRTPEQIFRNLSEDMFTSPLSILHDNFAEYDQARIKEVALQNLERMSVVRRWLLRGPKEGDESNQLLNLNVKEREHEQHFPELLAFFLYEPHDEFEIMSYLERNSGWKSPQERVRLSHADCVVHDAAGYLFYRTYKKSFLAMEVNAAISIGKISRDEGMKLLERECSKHSGTSRASLERLAYQSGIAVPFIRVLPVYLNMQKRAYEYFRRLRGSVGL